MSVDVTFVPGFLCDERLFAHQVAELRCNPLVASVTVADITSGSSIADMAQAVLDQSGDRFVVVGLSLGGIVAAEIAHIAPARLLGVALFDTNLDAPSDAQIAQRTTWAQRVGSGELFRVVVDDLVEPLTSDVHQHAPLILDMALRAGAETFVQQNEALLHRRDRRDSLATLPVPILVAVGREDGLCPPHLHRDLAARIPHAELVEVADAGHLSTIDQPAATAGALGAWLASCENTNQQPTGGRTNEYTNA